MARPGRRPGTLAPIKFTEIDTADLIKMTDKELIMFADKILSIPILTRVFDRNDLIAKISNSAILTK